MKSMLEEKPTQNSTKVRKMEKLTKILKEMLDAGEVKRGDLSDLGNNLSQNNIGHWIRKKEPRNVPEKYQMRLIDLLLKKKGLSVGENIDKSSKLEILSSHSGVGVKSDHEISIVKRYYSKGLFIQAAKEAIRIVESGLQSRALYELLGKSLEHRGRSKDAVMYFQKALNVAPISHNISNNSDELHNVAHSLHYTDKVNAKRRYMEAILADSTNYFVYHNLYSLHIYHDNMPRDDLREMSIKFNKLFKENGEALVITELLQICEKIMINDISDRKQIEGLLSEWNDKYRLAEIGRYSIDGFIDHQSCGRKATAGMKLFSEILFRYRPSIYYATIKRRFEKGEPLL